MGRNAVSCYNDQNRGVPSTQDHECNTARGSNPPLLQVEGGEPPSTVTWTYRTIEVSSSHPGEEAIIFHCVLQHYLYINLQTCTGLTSYLYIFNYLKRQTGRPAHRSETLPLTHSRDIAAGEWVCACACVRVQQFLQSRLSRQRVAAGGLLHRLLPGGYFRLTASFLLYI